jgi:hypothetical protein
LNGFFFQFLGLTIEITNRKGIGKTYVFGVVAGNGQIGFLITLNQPRRKPKNISEQGMNFKGFGSINFESTSYFVSHHAFHRLHKY